MSVLPDSLREVRGGQKKPKPLKVVTMVTGSMTLMRRDTRRRRRRRRAVCSRSWAQLLPSQMHGSVMVSYAGCDSLSL